MLSIVHHNVLSILLNTHNHLIIGNGYWELILSVTDRPGGNPRMSPRTAGLWIYRFPIIKSQQERSSTWMTEPNPAPSLWALNSPTALPRLSPFFLGRLWAHQEEIWETFRQLAVTGVGARSLALLGPEVHRAHLAGCLLAKGSSFSFHCFLYDSYFPKCYQETKKLSQEGSYS